MNAHRALPSIADLASQDNAVTGRTTNIVNMGLPTNSDAVFSPDGTRVLTASADGTARVWHVTWPELRDYLKDNVKACLTPKQRMGFLAESPSDARVAHAACEVRHGRKAEVRGHGAPSAS